MRGGNYKAIIMYECSVKTIIFFGVFISNFLQFSFASPISTGDYNKDFFITWSPSHVNTSLDGRSRNLKLDNDSGTSCSKNSNRFVQNLIFQLFFLSLCLSLSLSFIFCGLDINQINLYHLRGFYTFKPYI